MEEFKVGDKVRVLDGSDAISYEGGWVDTMNRFIDNEYRVCEVINSRKVRLDTGDYSFYVFDTRYLVKVSSATDSWSHNLVKKVIINEPATIIIWGDNSKTVVKCMESETFDPEKGIAMAYMKHVMFHDSSTRMNKWVHSQIPDVYTDFDDSDAWCELFGN